MNFFSNLSYAAINTQINEVKEIADNALPLDGSKKMTNSLKFSKTGLGVYGVDQRGLSYPLIRDIGNNLYIGVDAGLGTHRTGAMMISTGYDPTTQKGNQSIYIQVPSEGDPTTDTQYLMIHSGNLQLRVTNDKIVAPYSTALSRLSTNTTAIPVSSDIPSEWAKLKFGYLAVTAANELKDQPATGWLYNMSDSRWTTQFLIKPHTSAIPEIWMRQGDGASSSLKDGWTDWFRLDYSQGGTMSGQLFLTKANNPYPTSNNTPALVIGTASGEHLEVGRYAIIRKNGDSRMTTMSINDGLFLTDSRSAYLTRSSKAQGEFLRNIDVKTTSVTGQSQNTIKIIGVRA